MKKAMLGFIAAAMSLMATTANGAGDIRSIDPCDQYGYVIANGSMAQPYTVGETAYFRIRLLNLNYLESWNYKDSATKLSNPWVLEHSMGSLGADFIANQMAINPPYVGVFVSGQLRGAKVVSILPPTDKGWYTDIICAYTVRPGDLALPITLANSAGNEVGSGTEQSGENSEYYFDTIPKSGVWSLKGYEREGSDNADTPEKNEWNTVTATKAVEFSFGDLGTGLSGNEVSTWKKDLNLRQAGLYVKTIDFASPEYTVAEGRTDKITVNIEGGVNTNGNGVIYAMIKDGGAVKLAEDFTVKPFEVIEGSVTNTYDYQIAKVTIPSGEDVSSFSFKVTGVRNKGSETVYLSTTEGFSYGLSGDLITNFVTAVVGCVEPPPPFIAVTLDGESRKTVTSGKDYADYAAKLTVTLSEAYESDFSVKVKATLNGDEIAVGTSFVGISMHSESDFTGTNTVVKFTAEEMASGVLSKDLYVYVLGGNADTAAIDKGIKFIPEARDGADSYYKSENHLPATLLINRSKPAILTPEEGFVHPEISGGVAYAFTVKIADDYMNLKGGYAIEWYNDGAGERETIDELTPDSEGEITVNVTYVGEGEHYTKFRVKNSSDVYSEYRNFTVPVRKAKTVHAEVLETPDSSGKFLENVGELNVKFVLSEPNKKTQPIYAYLIPWNKAASNQVECAGMPFTEGVPVLPGQSESLMVVPVKVLDGTVNALLRFKVVLSSSDVNTGRLTEGYADYTSQDLYITVVNKAPEVKAVTMSGSLPVQKSGDTFKNKASIGLGKIFGLTVEDVDADRTNKVKKVEWNFSDPDGYLTTTSMVDVLLSDVVLTNEFQSAGTYDCSVKIQDKDMTDTEFANLAPFEFKVIVSEKPSVVIKFPSSNTYNETDADKGLSYFDVELTAPASAPIEVALDCKLDGASGVLNLMTNTITFKAKQTSQRVLIDELDGTPDSVSFKGGFTVTAKVVTTDKNNDGVSWSEVYDSAAEKVFVDNEPPLIVLPVDNGATNTAPINVDIPLKWKIDDVDFDLNDNLTVTWITSEGDMFETNGNDVAEGVFTTRFRSGGDKTITLTVMDKDGESSKVVLYYTVAASKQVHVYPMGPYYGGLTALSRRYVNASGIGEGSALANGTRNTEGFAHTYTFGATVGSATITAKGYASGYKDMDINASGNTYKDGDAPYAYNDRLQRDSFFYAWLIAAKEEESTTYAGAALIAPAAPKAVKRSATYDLTLPAELAGDKSNPMYADSFIEVYFAKEFYAADNMGDMNSDGVPDHFATKYWSMQTGEEKTIPEAMTGVAIAGSKGGEDDGEGEAATASDLANIATYNGDLDFIPVSWTSANPLKPTNCGPGQPFTALKEIRGYGIGLNEPDVSDYELTAAETCALYAAYALAHNGTAAADYASATNWATLNGWTPECISPLSGARLNPLNSDTDGDGLGDGWEYYFWYYAKVGAIVNGKWGLLEGRRYDAASPTMSTRIAPEDIAEAFNPHLIRETEAQWGVDFDNDGLTDLEEFVLGTNPCDWDTDGDGASDLYEVMSGLDPVSADGALNPDCDFMARCEYVEDTFTLYTFADGKVFALPTATSSSIAPVEPASTSSFYKVEVAVGDETSIYWAETKPVTYTLDDAEYLADGVDAFATLDVAGVVYRGEKTVLSAGTKIASVGADPEPVPDAILPEGGISWNDPDALKAGSTAKALEVFNYGGDGVTFVPCTTNVSTYVDLPLDQAVVKVQTEAKITLMHNQVYVQYGFDPRVAWNIDKWGLLDNRWRAQDSENVGDMGDAGKPTNTVAFTSADEYLVMQYRAKVHANEYAALPVAPSVDALTSYTTFPNLPLDFLKDNDKETSSDSGASSNATQVVQIEKPTSVHGADTDEDGVPDGWELYVASSANVDDAGRYLDGDKLNLAQEYAGVDSCNAYTNRFNAKGELIYPEVDSITKNHPGKSDGWWNKFFPTNPLEDDTDGDGLADHEERDSYAGKLPVGRNEYSTSFTFIYGDNAEKYAMDGTTKCFRGGGLNPCTVDTDCDLLPDPWEYEFAGIVFADGKFNAALSDADFATLVQADAYQGGLDTNSAVQIRGGMDGTFKADADYDFDHDGLINCQEYLVQSLRHLRYDDSKTPLMGVDPDSKKFVRFLPFSAWDGNAFHTKCRQSGFPGIAAWKFRELGYFALPPHSWDQIALNKAGLSSCANYAHSEGAGYRVMLRPMIEVLTLEGLKTYQAKGYASTDPRCWDTDNDGMDDYYEIFHGLNPLLGSSADPKARNENGRLNRDVYDVVGRLYPQGFDAWSNEWTGYANTQPAFDAIQRPWMIGTMECDADGDGLRNDEESLKVNLAKPLNSHTDPTPLWMTDSSSKYFASFTSQYYGPDPYLSETPTYIELESYPDIFCYPWKDLRWNTVVNAPGSGGINRDWMFSFEENEGYDTDHDFKPDSVELVRKVEPTSDPLNFSDPSRRQALYLPGEESAAVSYNSESRRSVGTEPDLLKQFTVECWVYPEEAQADKVIIERVCVYGASTLSNNQTYVRANFRIGIDAEGRAYGEYEGSTVDSGKIHLKGQKLPAGEWSHIAFTYNGYTAALYMNGDMVPVASANGVGLIPANGIDGILQESGTSVMPYTGYRALPCANIVGARALTPEAVNVTPETTWGDFGSFYKGWIDEVRVWDGARTPMQIHDNYLKRYTFEEISAQRDTVYKAWRNGATRADHDPATALPAELLLHYNFASIPGGIAEENVIKTPAGFQAAVLDNVRKTNFTDIDFALTVGWWEDLAVKSTVYDNYAVVPWIENTVAHLPLMDGSSVDSQYWNAYAAGLISAESIGKADGYTYPNSANPYSSYVYRFERVHHLNNLASAWTLSSPDGAGTISGDPRYDSYMFQLRSDFVGTSDLIPLGGAFAKRGETFWDGQGAMDAWTLTSDGSGAVDSDGDGIPDWAEALGYTTAEKYLSALAEGLIPVQGFEVKNAAFADVADANNDGLYDWWQRLYDLKGNAKADSDMDGLADFAEYLVTNVFKFADISPVVSRSNGVELDYFRRIGSLYLGQIFADHDFIEDDWENMFAKNISDSSLYDPFKDFDADGWSNYAECRAGTLPDRTATITAEGRQVPEYPVPMISVTASYRDARNMTAPIIVRAYAATGNATFADAQWRVPGSSEAGNYDYIVGSNPRVKTTCFLGPGNVIPGSVHVFFRNQTDLVVTDGKGTWSNPADAQWREVMVEQAIPGNTEMVDIVAGDTRIGTLVYRTGEMHLDFSALPKYRYEVGDSYQYYPPQTNTYVQTDLDDAYVMVQWQGKRLEHDAKWQFGLARADKGYIKEGKNNFVAFIDFDGDGEYSNGEPMGVARDVDVGWNGTTLDIEITDMGRSSPRIDLGLPLDETSVARNTNVRVKRIKIDGFESTTYGTIVNPDVMEFSVGGRNFLYDSDFIAPDAFDMDWAKFQANVMQLPMVTKANLAVTAVTYRVYTDTASLYNMTSNKYEFTHYFTKSHITAKPSNISSVNYGARPVFKWTIGEGADTYTAFSVQVSTEAGVVIWNSGMQRMPPRNSNDEYEWTANVYVEDIASPNKMFANNTNYKWQISLHNSKFQNAKWSEAQTFRMNVYDASDPSSMNRGEINATVKYFGPAEFNTDVSRMTGIIRVEAYTTPDFTGVPAGRTFVKDYVSVTNDSYEANVKLIGLESGTYYLRAFIDSDGDAKRSDWESWGYACTRGDMATGRIFTPVAIRVGTGLAPREVCYIEDTDLDQDTLPDVYEYDVSDDKSQDFLENKGVIDNCIAVNPDLRAAIDSLTGAGATPAMLSAGSGMMSMNLASLALGMPTLENSVEEGTLAIKSIALEGDNVNLTVGAAADEPAKGTVFVSDGKVTVTIVVSYADTLGGAWNSTELTKTFEIEDGSVADTLTFSLKELGLDSSKGFFKVELK